MKKILLLLCIIIFNAGLSAQTPRLSLYEEFTGENCIPCAGANPALDALLALPTNTAKCVAIKWQVPIPTAPSASWSLYQTNKQEIDWRYSSVGTGGYGYAIMSAPVGKMDGQNVTVFGASSDSPQNLTSNVIATAQSIPSAFHVAMARAWDATCSAITLTIGIQATANFTATGNLIFRTVMVERHIQFATPPGTNGEMTFEDVSVKSYPNLPGGTIMASNWLIGQIQTFTLNCVIPSYIRKKSEIAFVGFIQDDGNKKVAQSVLCDKQALPDDAKAISGIMDVVCGSSFNPIVTIKNNGTNAITNMTITPYVDGIAGSQTFWSGNLAASSSTNLTLSTFNTPATVGAHTFSFTINAINTTDFDLTNNSAKVSFAVASSFQSSPVVEGFVPAVFPPANFTHVNPDNGPAWSRVSSSGIGGYGLSAEAAKYEFYKNTVIGDVDEFILPPVDLTGSNTPYLLFDVAYAQRNLSSNDKLEVFVSDNCGTNWTNVYSKSGSGLTIVPPYDGSEYFPGSSEWITEIVSLNNFNKPAVLVKYVTTNGNGNNLYLDNINLSLTSPTGISKTRDVLNASVFPNPAENKVNIRIVTDEDDIVKTTLIDVLGKVVSEKETAINSGANLISLNAETFSPGVYSLIILSKKGTVTKKISITGSVR